MNRNFTWVVLQVLLIISCSSRPEALDTAREERIYLFLGHTYDWLYEDRIDPRLERINYSDYSGVWLGGDICARTTKSEQTLVYLDRIFDLQSANTLWAWGNHDLLEGDTALLQQATGRPSYYTYFDKGLLVIVLNTNLFWHHPWAPPTTQCAEKLAHYKWLHHVLDTVKDASQLVMLHHHGLFNEYKVSGHDTLSLGNVDAIPVRPLCDSLSNFTLDLYPRLVDLQHKGVAITLVSGDVGMRSKGYHFTTPEGIQLLGSGINNSLDMNYPPDYVTNFNPDSVLQIHYQPQEKTLSWSFIRLNELLDTTPAMDRRLRQLMADY